MLRSLSTFSTFSGSPTPLRTSCKVSIAVHQPSAQPPSFGDGSGMREVTENLAPGSKIMSVSASGTNNEYFIVGGNEDGKFTLSRDGQLALASQQTLDHEESPRRDLVIRAVDKAMSPSGYAEKVFTVVVRDTNDNAPVFAVDNPNEEKKIFVDRHSPEGTIVQRVSLWKGKYSVECEFLGDPLNCKKNVEIYTKKN